MIKKSATVAAFEAQPTVEAMVLVFAREKRNQDVLTVAQVRDLLERAFGVKVSSATIAESFEEGARLGLWQLIGKAGQSNYIEVSQMTTEIYHSVLSSQSESTLHAIERAGPDAFRRALYTARQEATSTHDDHSQAFNNIQIALRRIEHNTLFQRGLVATKGATLQTASARLSKAQSPRTIDWTKWGTIFGALSILVAVLIAVFS